MAYFKAFGCECFIHNNGKEHLSKFQPKADSGIFLGYSNHSKAYKVYNKRLQKVEESIHVTFNESKDNKDDLQEDIPTQKVISDKGPSSEEVLSVLEEQNQEVPEKNTESQTEETSNNAQREEPAEQVAEERPRNTRVNREVSTDLIIGNLDEPVRTRSTTINESLYCSFLS